MRGKGTVSIRCSLDTDGGAKDSALSGCALNDGALNDGALNVETGGGMRGHGCVDSFVTLWCVHGFADCDADCAGECVNGAGVEKRDADPGCEDEGCTIGGGMRGGA